MSDLLRRSILLATRPAASPRLSDSSAIPRPGRLVDFPEWPASSMNRSSVQPRRSDPASTAARCASMPALLSARSEVLTRKYAM